MVAEETPGLHMMIDVGPSRRLFMGGISLAGAAALVPIIKKAAVAGGLETTSVRLVQDPSSCLAPEFVAEALLRDEGFTDVRYIAASSDADDQKMIASGAADFAMDFALKFITSIDAGDNLTVLGGIHVGCFELFAKQAIHTIRDLKGKSIGVGVLGESAQAFLVTLGAAIGFDALRDVDWVTKSTPPPLERFISGDLDAFLAHPPEVQQLRARRAGHVLVSSIQDRPWADHYCCMLGANTDFIQKHPVATKAVLRAILHATDICASDPARAARRVIERKADDDYDNALRTVREIRYGEWRDHDSADTMRFYALRLYEAGMIKSTPNKIIEKGTDWRFLQEVQRELKG
jgi:NitT/TauT family transport system substrate-binding protein